MSAVQLVRTTSKLLWNSNHKLSLILAAHVFYVLYEYAGPHTTAWLCFFFPPKNLGFIWNICLTLVVSPCLVFSIVMFTGGLGTFHGMINSFVHMVMYTYYAIAAMGPEYQKYIWWKKYLTVFQMVRLFNNCLKCYHEWIIGVAVYRSERPVRIVSLFVPERPAVCLWLPPPLPQNGGTGWTVIQVHAVNLIEIRLGERWQPISNQSWVTGSPTTEADCPLVGTQESSDMLG